MVEDISRNLRPVQANLDYVSKGRNLITVIGIDDYEKWPKLSNAVNDAMGIQKIFVEKLGFISPIPALLNSDATQKNLTSLVQDQLCKVVQQDDALIVFFAGHGHTRLRQIPGMTIETGYIIPVEAQNNQWADYIKIDSFLEEISQLPARHILVILDACHSGFALGNAMNKFRDAVSYEQALLNHVSRKVITSARRTETALDGGPIQGHSLFTGTLVHGLDCRKADLDGNGLVTSSELGLFLQQQVGQASESKQTPDFGSFHLDDHGEMVISLRDTKEGIRTVSPQNLSHGEVIISLRDTKEEDKQRVFSWAKQLINKIGSCPPDLCILVHLENDKRTLRFDLFNTHEINVNTLTDQDIKNRLAEFDPVSLKEKHENMIKALYSEMNQMGNQLRVDAVQRMAALGNELWDDLIPEKLKQEYWLFRDHVRSMLITSNELWIPWEMIKPYRYNDNGKTEDDLFWCLKFELSRWLSESVPGGELPTGTAQPVAPAQVNLPGVQEEITFIEQLSNLNPSVIGLAPLSDKVHVLNFIENGDFSLLHIATNGWFDETLPNNSEIQLSDGFLRPSDIHTRFGSKRSRPLIFINTCDGLGGWADRLVNKAQVGAFACAMWYVQDELALMFVKSFYIALLQEVKTIAQAFRIAREKVKEANPSSSTWLGYVLFANPEAQIRGVAMPSHQT